MSENKRYFKREWEEEYYVFDSETISESEVDKGIWFWVIYCSVLAVLVILSQMRMI